MSSLKKRFKFLGNLSYIFGVALVIASLLVNAFPPRSALALVPSQDPQLNISHILCVDGQVEIHFVLLNVPDGVTPGTLTYTYGSVAAGKNVGNVWHYYDYKPDGYYNITSASVDVNGVTVTLHNPGAYADTYQCGTKTPTETPTETLTSTPTETITETPTGTPTETVEGKITICHVDGQVGSFKYQVLTIGFNAVYGPGGHLNEGGSAQAGHELDFLIENENDLARCSAPTETPVTDPFSVEFYCMGFTVTNMNPFTAAFDYSVEGGPSGQVVLESGKSVSIDLDNSLAGALVTVSFEEEPVFEGTLPTECVIETPTPTELVGLQVVGFCLGPNATNFGWRVTNPNAFSVDFEWRVNGSILAGLRTVGANSTVDFDTPKSEGSIIMVYVGGELLDEATGVATCRTTQETPAPTPPPSVRIPVTGSTTVQSAVLIPVTGLSDDLANMTPSALLNFGLGLLGLGLVMHGIARRRIL